MEYIKVFWDALNQIVEHHRKIDSYIKLNKDKYPRFESYATNLYENIKSKYMKPSTKSLDRHKLSAIMIVSAVENEVVSYDRAPNSNFVFLGCEMFAAEAALECMRKLLNDKLEEAHCDSKVERFYMPDAFACDTPYFDIFCRNLYYAKKDYQLNPLELSEKLFLLEYITIIKKDINTSYLHDNKIINGNKIINDEFSN